METKQFVNLGVPVSQTVLDNGFTVITADVPSDLVYVNLTFTAGALDDLDQHGIAHLLEHMMCEGPARDGVHPNFRELIQHGVFYGASTNWNYTEYRARGLAEDGKEIAAALMEIGFDIHLDQSNLEREKGVVIQEINDEGRGWGTRLWEWKKKLFYPSFSVLHRPIAGSRESVMAVGFESLQEHSKRLLQPFEAALFVAGDAPHEAVVRLCLEKTTGNKAVPTPSLRPFHRSIVRESYCDQEARESTSLYYNVFDRNGDRRYSGVLLDLLIGFPFGILMQQLRMKEGLVYQIGGNLAGSFMPHCEIVVNANKTHFDHIEEEVVRCLQTIANGDIANEPWKTAMSRQHRYFASWSHADDEKWGQRLRSKWLEGDEKDIDYDKIVMSTTREDVAKLAAEVLSRGPLGRIDVVKS